VVRRLTVAVAVAVLAVAAATVDAEPAQAYYDSILTQQDWEVVNGWLNSPAEPPVQSIKTNSAAARAWLKTRAIIGRVPRFSAGGVTTITLGAGAFYLGWELPHTTGVSDWLYGKIAGIGPAQAQPTSGTIRAYYWKVVIVSGTVYVKAGLTPTTSEYAAVPEIRYSMDSGVTWSTRPGYASGCVQDGAGVTPCDDMASRPYTYQGAKFDATNGAIIDALLAAGWAPLSQYTETVNGDQVKTVVFGENEDTFQRSRFSPTEQRPYNSSTDAGRKTHTGASTALSQPTPEYGSTTQAAAEQALEEDDTLSTEIGTILHPQTDTGGDGSTVVTLPQPRLNETAEQYRARLRALGFLGTIVLSYLDLASALPQFGPQAVTQVQVQTQTGTQTYPLTAPWPDPPPTLTVPGETTQITVTANPADAPEPAPGTPPPPGAAPKPGGGGIGPGDCSCPPPDFSAITGLAYGDKFPFGVVSLVTGTLGTTLYAQPDAPTFSFDFDWLGIEPDYVVDLDVLDPYVSAVRTILSWCIWIGGLWWFGSRSFGFKDSGDVGAAVDEVV
jgi:hypothetical protein